MDASFISQGGASHPQVLPLLLFPHPLGKTMLHDLHWTLTVTSCPLGPRTEGTKPRERKAWEWWLLFNSVLTESTASDHTPCLKDIKRAGV